ncbi:MAG: response regulator transcription factor [Bacteroidales bacterium]|nr:response regulator transcription factor [Bacteroidales bacterium]
MKKAKILVIEPSEMVFLGLQTMLRHSNSLDIAGHCTDIEQIFPMLTRYKADIALVNPSIFARHDILGIRSYFQDYPSLLLIALRYAYYPQNIINQFDCCIDIDDTLHYIESKIDQTFQKRHSEIGTHANSELTKKEKEVLALIIKGKLNKEIAEELNLSIHTIITHRKNISKKTDIKSISGLTIYALLHNLIQKEDIL